MRYAKNKPLAKGAHGIFQVPTMTIQMVTNMINNNMINDDK